MRKPPWAGWRLGVVAAGLVVLFTAWLVSAIDDDRLGRLADQSQMAGLVLTVLGFVLQGLALRRQHQERSVPVETLARRVRQREQQARLALLGETDRANLSFEAGTRKVGLARLWNVVRYQDDTGVAGDLASIGPFYTELGSGRLVVEGEPGSGKTVMIIELVLWMLGPGRVEGRPVPVRLSMAGWDTALSLEEWLAERLVFDYAVPVKAARELVEDRQVLPVLDGLDEMDTGTGTERATAALGRLNDYLHGIPRGPVVVTCRRLRYRQLAEQGTTLRDATRIRILPLDADRVRGYVGARFAGDPGRLEAWKEVLAGRSELAGALSTPWRLHLAVTLSQAGGDPRDLARAVRDGGQRAVDALLLERYVSARVQMAGGRYREARVEVWLRHLARSLEDRAAPGSSGVDLIPHLLWPMGGRRLVRVLHVCVVSVALAGWLGALAWRLFGPPENWVDYLRVSFYYQRAGLRSDGWLLMLDWFRPVAWFLGTMAWVVWWCSRRWPMPIVVTRTRTRVRRESASFVDEMLDLLRIARWFVALLAVLMGMGFGLSLLAVLAPSAMRDAEPTLIFWATACLFAAGGGALGTMLVRPVLTARWWSRQVAIASPRVSLGLWSPIAVLAALAVGVVMTTSLEATVSAWLWFEHLDPSTMEWVGGNTLPVGMPSDSATYLGVMVFSFAVAITAQAAFRYRLGLGIAAAKGYLPWRVGRFLDWAADSGLLRVSGNAYQFRHLELQRWLTG